MADASCVLMAGYKLSEIFSVDETVEKIQKYDENTGKPYTQEIKTVDLFLFGNKIEVNGDYPLEWEFFSKFQVCGVGDGEEMYGQKGLLRYPLTNFVFGRRIAHVDKSERQMICGVSRDAEQYALDKVKEDLVELCRECGVTPLELAPKLYLVLNYSY